MTTTRHPAALRRRRLHLARRPLPRAHRAPATCRADRRPRTSSASPRTRHLRGRAVRTGHALRRQVAELAAAGADVDQAVFAITTDDVRDACDIFAPVYEPPTASTAACRSRWTRAWPTTPTAPSRRPSSCTATVDRPNVLIKIPATLEGLPAITATIAEGISVNVTLIFSLERYRAVIERLPRPGSSRPRRTATTSSTIHSVASFFVSRVDTEIDKRLDAIGTDEASALKGKAGVANARLAYQVYEEVFATDALAAPGRGGARPQRPLWASTGVKDPAYPDTLYVTELVAPDVVNTMPEKTLDAVADHGEITGDTVTGNYADANQRPRRARRARHLLQRRRRRCSSPRASTSSSTSWQRAAGRRPGRPGPPPEGVQKDHDAAQLAPRAPRRQAVRPAPARTWSRTRSPPGSSPRTPPLWGPDAEAEASIRLGWVEARHVSRPLVAEILALREELAGRGRRPGSCCAAWAAPRWLPRSSPAPPASS